MQRAPNPFADLEKRVVRCCFGHSTLRPYDNGNSPAGGGLFDPVVPRS
jgi:hypothetical protein